MTRTLNYIGGPKPSTPRGKRRHAGRTGAAALHAKKVHEGGYRVNMKPGQPNRIGGKSGGDA